VKGELLAHGVQVISVTEPVYDPRTVAGLAIEKMTEFKNAVYSLDVAFHTRKAMRENIARRDGELGYCYKNGGAPPFGFKGYRVQRGTDRKGIPLMKTLWKLDDTLVGGRLMHGWARHVLVDLRLHQRASLDHIRDVLNKAGVPAPRRKYWGTSSVRAILQPSLLLQYAGYGVWNVHGKHGKINPPSEWEVVENGHPAIITMEEAQAIQTANEELTRKSGDRSRKRMETVSTQRSPYLLSGGLMICKRCGANMTSHINRGHAYYVCGTRLYRKGLGCGRAFQVRKDHIEEAVLEEIGRLFNSWADTDQLMQLVQKGLSSMAKQQHASAEEDVRQLAKIDEEMNNVRNAVKAGYDDLEWANAELRRLRVDREEIVERQRQLETERALPTVTRAVIEEYRRQFVETFAFGSNEEKREFARLFVSMIEVDPDTADIFMHMYEWPAILATKNNIPPLDRRGMHNGLVAGAGG